MPKVSFRLKLRTLLRVLGPSVHFHSPSFIPDISAPAGCQLWGKDQGLRADKAGAV